MSGAARPVRILHLEDDPNDATLIHRALQKRGAEYDYRHVQTREAFVRELAAWDPDLILADYHMPDFDGLAALDLIRGKGIDTPFIFVSGTIGEEKAIEVLRRGANDYVIKDRLVRLPTAVARALADREERRKLAEAQRSLHDIAATVREAFWILNPRRDRVEYVSPSYERIWGRRAEDVVGHGLRKLLGDIHPDDRAQAEADFGRLLEGDVEMEHRIVRPDGTTRWVRFRSYAVRDGKGELDRVIGAAEDVTEARRLKEQFLQAQKMEAVGRLAGGVAHDFNNLLTVIGGFADLALERLDAGDPVREMVQQVRDAGDKAAHLTRQLLTFSRRQPTEPRSLNLSSVVGGLEKMLRRLIGDDIHLVTELVKEPWSVHGDPGQIAQVVLNLAVNARDALPKGGTVTIRVRNAEVEAAPGRKAGAHVQVSVADNGIGMSEQVQERLFEPFFTTKEPGKGTGLGLSTVHGIALQSGGFVEVLSAPGQGTTMSVYLPKAQEEAPKRESRKRTAPAAKRGGEMVLLVEDSETIRRLCEEMLKSGGYRVRAALDGEQGLELLRRDGKSIDLLLTDMNLPGSLGGQDLVEEAARQGPRMRVLRMSGYARTRPEEGAAYLEKPFSRDSLLKKIREVLDAS